MREMGVRIQLVTMGCLWAQGSNRKLRPSLWVWEECCCNNTWKFLLLWLRDAFSWYTRSLNQNSRNPLIWGSSYIWFGFVGFFFISKTVFLTASMKSHTIMLWSEGFFPMCVICKCVWVVFSWIMQVGNLIQK